MYVLGSIMRHICRLALWPGLLFIFFSGFSEAQSGQPLADATPRYAVYYNSDATPLSAVRKSDYSHVILSFVRVVADDAGKLVIMPPEHMLGQWKSVSALKSAGKTVMISFGGGLADTAEYTALVGREPEVAELLASWVESKNLDGIDIDFEADAMFHQERQPNVGNGRQFLIDLTRALRQHLPAPRYLLSHAPEPPFLDPDWHNGPYLDVLANVGDQIDWIAVQYYNNGTYDNPVPGTSEIARTDTTYAGLTDASGHLQWPPRKVMVGKPIYHADASNGHLSPDDVISQIIKPLIEVYGADFGGLVGWQYSDLTDDHRAWNYRVGRALKRKHKN